MHLSFAGCGFLGIYHVGVSSCFKEYAPHVYSGKIAGSSAGAIAACALLCGCCLGKCTSYVLRIASKARHRALGPLHPSFQVVRILLDGLRHILPADAHLTASGRLHISLTRVSDGRNVLVSRYDTRDELIQALICSSYVPFYSGIVPPKFKGVRYMDGGLSNNLPILDENTITVSPFAGESDICPNDNSANFIHINLTHTSIQMTAKNIYRMSRAFFPPHPEILSNMCKQGFDDALHFLQANSLISCTRCLSMKSVISVREELHTTSSGSTPSHTHHHHSSSHHQPTLTHHDNHTAHHSIAHPTNAHRPPDDCNECVERKQIALLDTLPAAVVHVLESTVDDANHGLLAKVYKYRAAKLLALMSIPWLLPLDISYYIAIRVVEYVPALPKDMYWVVGEMADKIRDLLYTVRRGRHKYTAKFSCQFALTEVEEEDSTVDSHSPSTPTPSSSLLTLHMTDQQELHLQPSKIKNVNFGFTVNWEAENMSESGRQLAENHNTLQMAEAALRFERDDSVKQRVLNSLDGEYAHTFENCVDVTNHHEALMAYYYVDEDGANGSGLGGGNAGAEVNVVEIFDVSDRGIELGILEDEERDIVARMSWDNDAHLTPPLTGDIVRNHNGNSDSDNGDRADSSSERTDSTSARAYSSSERVDSVSGNWSDSDTPDSELELSLDE